MIWVYPHFGNFHLVVFLSFSVHPKHSLLISHSIPIVVGCMELNPPFSYSHIPQKYRWKWDISTFPVIYIYIDIVISTIHSLFISHFSHPLSSSPSASPWPCLATSQGWRTRRRPRSQCPRSPRPGRRRRWPGGKGVETIIDIWYIYITICIYIYIYIL